MEDQTTQNALSRFAEIQAYDVHESGAGGDRSKRQALAKLISDWHLVAFLGTSGLLGPVSGTMGIETRTTCLTCPFFAG